ncbi:MAG: TSUP family transporter [Planctomycetota bacterium]|nr:TSUP family transporter [Planctomycetota bacterium]
MLIAAALFLVGMVAGFVDAIAGGGGLLTVPALFLTGIDPHLAMGTNKAQGVFGTATSLQRFSGSSLLDRKRAKRSFVPALVGAAAGVFLLMHVKPQVLRPLVMAMLAGVAIFMIVHRAPAVPRPPRHRGFILTGAVAFILAFYDGFFGPGTGTFLIVAYAYFWGDSLDSASANAKVVNFGSNFASMVTFAALGQIRWKLALPMAAGQVVGGYLGAHATIRAGRKLVRLAVVMVSIALIARLLWDLVRS